MSAIERRLSEALTGGATQVEPAPDLFARVRSSIDDDRRRRRRLVRWGLIAVTVLVAALAAVIPGVSAEEEDLSWTGGFWSCSRHCCSSVWRCGSDRSSSGSVGPTPPTSSTTTR